METPIACSNCSSKSVQGNGRVVSRKKRKRKAQLKRPVFEAKCEMAFVTEGEAHALLAAVCLEIVIQQAFLGKKGSKIPIQLNEKSRLCIMGK